MRPVSRVVQLSPFNWGTLINVASIPLLTLILYFGIDYVKNGDKVNQHDQEIKQERIAREQAHKDDAEKREALRDALTNFAAKTSEGISKLAEHAAVQDEQIKNINGNLDKVVNGLQNIELAVGRGKNGRP